MSDFKHMKVKMGKRTTTLAVLDKKLKILSFISLNARQPSVHSGNKKEVALAWAMKNYTTKISSSYDSIFHAEVMKAQKYMQVKKEYYLLKTLEKAEHFTKKNGYRVTHQTDGYETKTGFFARLSYIKYNSRLMKNIPTFKKRLTKIFAYPTRKQFELQQEGK